MSNYINFLFNNDFKGNRVLIYILINECLINADILLKICRYASLILL